MEAAPPLCTSCAKQIPPGDHSTKFRCPGCREVVIWRCEECRRFSNTYVCPKCGYQGP
ncbi:MAG: RNA-binding protein [Methanobacteriota archaeon]|nr:MAG: RNA-binding protein [Euryarchaeota archaeon]